MPAGTSLFTLLVFAGLYLFIGLLFLMLLVRIVAKGPDEVEVPTTSARAAAGSQPQGA